MQVVTKSKFVTLCNLSGTKNDRMNSILRVLNKKSHCKDSIQLSFCDRAIVVVTYTMQQLHVLYFVFVEEEIEIDVLINFGYVEFVHCSCVCFHGDLFTYRGIQREIFS